MRALSALDVALWDALGQVTGVPVYQLLGGANRAVGAGLQHLRQRGAQPRLGPCRRRPRGPGRRAARPRVPRDEGLAVGQVRPPVGARGSTGPAGWSSMGPVGSYLSLGDLASGLSMLERARDRIGSSFELLVEGHSRWDINMALRICRALEPIDVLWVEDICQPDSAEDLARLVRETRVPQAVSERLISRFAFREVLRHQAAHIVLVDVAWTGGLSEAKRVADLAATYHLSFAPHDCTGPVTALANLHLAIAQPNCIGVEVVRGFVDGYYRQVLDPLALRPWPPRRPGRPGPRSRPVGGFPGPTAMWRRFLVVSPLPDPI